MASVALLLALNSVLASPFILLDEIDANLDPDNAKRYIYENYYFLD
jgi:chromosome segregation ATPase